MDYFKRTLIQKNVKNKESLKEWNLKEKNRILKFNQKIKQPCPMNLAKLGKLGKLFAKIFVGGGMF